jgi:hypothetical protein
LAIDGLTCATRFFTSRQLIGAGVEDLAHEPPAAICLVHLASEDSERVRGRVRRLGAALPETPMVVARLGGAGFGRDERAALAKSGATNLVTSLAELRSRIAARLVAQPSTQRDGGQPPSGVAARPGEKRPGAEAGPLAAS